MAGGKKMHFFTIKRKKWFHINVIAVSCSVPGSGRSPGGGHGNPLQYSCLEHPMDRGAWWATVQRVTKIQDTTEQPTLSLSCIIPKQIHWLYKLWSAQASPKKNFFFLFVGCFRVFIKFMTILLLFEVLLFFFFLKHGTWDLSSPTRDWTAALEGKVLATGLPWKSSTKKKKKKEYILITAMHAC